MKTVLLITIAFFSLGVAGLITGYIAANDKEISLRNQVEAQNDVCRANFDKMFKTITQVSQVPERFIEQSKEAFKEIYPELMEGRYGNARGGALMSWVQESNPNFDMAASGKLYENIQRAVETNRQEFFIQQQKLIEFKRAHTTFISTFWNRNLYGLYGRGEIEIILIDSETTDEVYKNGQENDIDLF